MFLEKDKPHRILLLCLCIITIIFGVMIYVVPPGADPDPSWGFEVMKCMESGGGFNLNSSPDPANIAKSTSEFLSWWSPGQYMMPYFFKTVFRVNLGHALALTICLCSLIGIAGFYKLFTRLGFTPWLASISIAFIMVQQFYILPYVFYTGGEVLLFAFMGWFLYGCFGFKKISWQLLAYVFAAGLVGFFAKSSVLWMYAGGVACIWINLSAYSKKVWVWLRNGAFLGIPMIAAVAIIYVFYLSKGDNPSDATGAMKILPETFTYPLASPLLAGFSLDELFKGLIYHPDGPMFSYPVTIAIIVLIGIGSIVFVFMVIKYVPNKNYALVMTVFYVVATLFFSDMYLKQAAISYEGRHFRIVGLLAIPGVVYLLSKTTLSRVLLAVIWVGFLNWNFHYFKAEYQADKDGPHGSSGLSQQLYDKETLDELTRLDQLHHNNAIFVLTNPDIAPEINNNRILTLDIDDMPKEDFAAMKYLGKAGAIYMLMPKVYFKSGQAQGVANAFKDYHNFTVKQLSKDYYLYWAED